MRFSVTKFLHQVFAEFQKNPRTQRPIGGGAGTWKQCPDGKKSFHFSIYNFKILPVNCYNLGLEPKCSFLKLCPRWVGRESSTSWWKGSEAFVVHLAWLSGDLQVLCTPGPFLAFPHRPFLTQDLLVHLASPGWTLPPPLHPRVAVKSLCSVFMSSKK